ncbi:MAG: UDP-N-acetylglucosamine 1-carboxyvinyltransferase [Symbiobacteriia bacterium]
MAKLVITGGKPLEGRVRISGRKNSALAIIPATLLAEGESALENVPYIRDVDVYSAILQTLGATVHRNGSGNLRVDASALNASAVPFDLAKQLRASYYLLGVLLARFGRAEVAMPGGDDLGPRPIDQHLKGFRALGAQVNIERGVIRVETDGLIGGAVYFDVVSVGATVNTMLAATLAEGTTIIENAAKEPHIVDLANYLNACGAKVRGAGTDVIRIRGVKRLTPATHAIIPDDIEAATFMVAAAATRGDVVLENVIPKHLEPITAKLLEAGAEVSENGDSIRVIAYDRPLAVNVKTMPYPGFQTDAMPPFTVMLAMADGTSVVTEGIWENRFRHAGELKKMGANVRVEGRTAVIEGVDRLSGAPVVAQDIRAGAALIVAGLVADGETEVHGIEHVDRGYERTEDKLRGLGARIERVQEPVVAD